MTAPTWKCLSWIILYSMSYCLRTAENILFTEQKQVPSFHTLEQAYGCSEIIAFTLINTHNEHCTDTVLHKLLRNEINKHNATRALVGKSRNMFCSTCSLHSSFIESESINRKPTHSIYVTDALRRVLQQTTEHLGTSSGTFAIELHQRMKIGSELPCIFQIICLQRMIYVIKPVYFGKIVWHRNCFSHFRRGALLLGCTPNQTPVFLLPILSCRFWQFAQNASGVAFLMSGASRRMAQAVSCEFTMHCWSWLIQTAISFLMRHDSWAIHTVNRACDMSQIWLMSHEDLHNDTCFAPVSVCSLTKD